MAVAGVILPDVNVLIYAFRPEAAQHGLARALLEALRSGQARFGISPLALSALVRITTNRGYLAGPSSIEDALAFCDDLLDLPHCVRVEAGPRHWPIFERLCRDANIRGPDITDAWFAALAIEWGCEWITFDRDFARFPGLRWSTPS